MFWSQSKNRSSKTTSRHLRVEALETRRLLAGNVTAEVSRFGNLLITGDADSNDIQIAVDPVIPGRVTIASGTDLTTINGLATEQTFQTRRDIRIDMNDGDDSVEVEGNDFGSATRNFIYDGGDGTNSLDVGSYIVPGIVQITNGDKLGSGGFFDVNLAAMVVGHDVTIHNGDGDWEVQIDGSTIGGDVRITNGDGNTLVTGEGNNVLGKYFIKNGHGFHMINGFNTSLIAGDVEIKNGAGGGEIFVGAQRIGKDLLIYTEDATDIEISSSIGDDVRIRNGEGTGSIRLESTDIGDDLYIETGGGAHHVSFGFSRFGLSSFVGDDLYILTRDGDSWITIDGLRVAGDATIKTQDATLGNMVFVGFNSEVHFLHNLTIRDGRGPSTVNLGAVRIGRNLNIITGDGPDTVLLNGDGVSDVIIAGDTKVNSGRGSDLLQIGAGRPGGLAVFGDRVAVEMGRDNDVLNVGNGVRWQGDGRFTFDGGRRGMDAITLAEIAVGAAIHADLWRITSFEQIVTEPTFLSPVAVDDFFVLLAESQDNLLDILNNDIPSIGNDLSVSNINIFGDSGGSFAINTNPFEMRYTPRSDFRGMFSFTYTLDNGSGLNTLTTATVTYYVLELG